MDPDDVARPSRVADPAQGEQAPADPSRRSFFRVFGRQTIEAAGSVIGAADAVRRGAPAIAGGVLDLGLGDPERNSDRLERRQEERPGGSESAAPPGFRSPYRVESDGTVLLLDQRVFPARAVTVECRDASSIAAAMHAGVVRGTPVLAQVAAYGMALAVARAERLRSAARGRAVSAAASALRNARPSVRPVMRAVEQMLERWAAARDGSDSSQRLVREAADVLASRAATDHAALAQCALAHLPRVDGRPVGVLVHGDGGPLSGGLVGTSLAVVNALVAAGVDVHVWITEARPSLEGARLTAWQLAQTEVRYTVIPDPAVGWLLGQRPVDVCLLTADWVAANGDAAALVGSLPVAALARRAGVPVLVCGPTTALDPWTADGAGIPLEMRSPDEVSDGGRFLSGRPAALNPAVEVVSGDLIDGFLTEKGLLTPPFEPRAV